MSGELLFFLSLAACLILGMKGKGRRGQERDGMGCIRKSAGYGLDDEVQCFVRVASTLVAAAHGVDLG